MVVQLNVHSDYSLLNGMARIPELVKRAKQCGMESVGLTDYGNVFGGVEFFLEAKKAEIKPILGCTVFLPSHDDHLRREFRRGQDQLWHLVLIVKNKQGYLNLCRLLTKSYLEGFYYKPRVDIALLKECSEGLIALSAGYSGEVNFHLYKEHPDAARQAAEKYAGIFKDGFYLELQDNGLDVQAGMNSQVVELAREKGLPLVATNNVHYLDRTDAEAFEVLRGIQMMRQWDSDLDRSKFGSDGYHFAPAEEMKETFKDHPEALANTLKIAGECEFQYDFKTYHFPRFDTPDGLTLDDLLAKAARQGLDSRWEEIKIISKKSDSDRPAYEERIAVELECVAKMGFAGYFLIVSDFIMWAKGRGIPVGPGRGSAAGSLVAYCVRITDLDPIPYHLLFERFLNPERVSMPDVDVDFCQDRRGEVIKYVGEKYGNVSQIITFGKMKAKAVIRDIGRVMELEYDYVDKIAKLIPGALNITLAEALEQEPRLKELYDGEDTVRRLIDVSLKLEGLNRHASVHAAGVIITDKPLWELAPLYKGSQDDVVVQYDMKSSEKIGLIKFDFLGLKTLTVIHNAVKNVKLTRAVDVDIARIPMDDPAVYAALSRGEGGGVFQLESSGMRDLMTRLKPSCFEDIIALVALYRPGPMDLIPDFIERKHGRQAVDCLDPRLESVLGPTYGIMVYQEQVMQIAQVLGGYTLGGADLLRRAMGKKDVKEMSRQRTVFQEGAAKNGISAERADHIFSLMEKFAGYGFNKSHAAAYALVSYQTAWLKTHYYPEYMAALMSSELEDTDKLQTFIGELKSYGTTVLPPDVNASGKVFSVEDGKIRYGLNALKGVGAAAVEAVLEARSDGAFQSFFDFCRRVDLRRVTKKVVEMLVKSGATDGFGMPRKALFDVVDAVTEAASRQQKAKERGQDDLFSDMDAAAKTPTGVVIASQGEWPQSEKLGYEKEAFGFYFSSHPLAPLAEDLGKIATHVTAGLKSEHQDTTVTLGGVIAQSRVITTKKGDRMAFATLQDLTGSVEVILFSRTYAQYRDFIGSDEAIIVKGSVDRSQEDVKIKVESISKLADTLKETIRSIHLEIPDRELSPDKMNEAIAILGRYGGSSSVFFHVRREGEFETVLELPAPMRAAACEPLKHHLDALFAGKVVRFH
jgi:DNA polymerase-3 subunit alpha